MPQPFGVYFQPDTLLVFVGPLFSGTSQDLLSVPDIKFFQRSLRVKNSSQPPPPLFPTVKGSVDLLKLGNPV